MTGQATQWLPGVLVMLGGLVSAALYLLLTRPRQQAAAPAAPKDGGLKDGVLEDLERRAQALIDQLKELEAEKHHLAPERYTAERSRLEQAAAAALRARDEHLKQRSEAPAGAAPAAAPAAAAAPAEAKGFWARNPQLVGAAWGGGVVLFFALLAWVLMAEQRPRQEGQEATGRVPPGSTAAAGSGQAGQAGQAGEDPALQRARERLRENPEDLETAALLSHELIRQQKVEEAARVTAKGLAVDPFNVELRVHRAVLRVLRGDTEGGRQELQQLADTWPDAQEALLFLGVMALQENKQQEALELFERFAVEVPREQVPPQLLTAIAEMRQRLGVKR